MEKKPSHKVIEKLKKNGKVISFKEVDGKVGVKNISSSCFIKEENVIVRGGDSFSSRNNALIMAIDAVTKELRGNKCFEFSLNLFAFPFEHFPNSKAPQGLQT